MTIDANATCPRCKSDKACEHIDTDDDSYLIKCETCGYRKSGIMDKEMGRRKSADVLMKMARIMGTDNN
jgi:uncharacterized Zn finger protein